MRSKITILFLAALMAVFEITPATANDGTIDPLFGSGGVAVFDDHHNAAADVVIQRDGKIIMVAPENNGFAVFRLNTDGSLDTHFGSNGETLIGFGTGNIGTPYALAIQPKDGKIVVVGSSSFFGLNGLDFTVVRLTTKGTLDSAFGTKGIVRTDFQGLDDIARCVAVQPDGRIVVAGSATFSSSDIKFSLARYNVDGTLDLGFSGNGKRSIGWGSGQNAAYSVVIQPDGKILAAGETEIDYQANFAIARFNGTDGSFDNFFGNGGKVNTGFTNAQGRGRSIALLPGGEFIVVGLSYNGATTAKYRSNGSPDTSFGTDGKDIIYVPLGLDAGAKVFSYNNKIIISSTTGEGDIYNLPCGFGDPVIFLTRELGNGVPDETFGRNGVVEFNPYSAPFGDPNYCGPGLWTPAFAIQSDGNIVAAGIARPTNANFLAVSRFLNQNPE